VLGPKKDTKIEQFVAGKLATIRHVHSIELKHAYLHGKNLLHSVWCWKMTPGMFLSFQLLKNLTNTQRSLKSNSMNNVAKNDQVETIARKSRKSPHVLLHRCDSWGICCL
jgi:hypothetical protein